MKALSSFGLCLIAALAAGCTFDSSQLRALPDGAAGNQVVPDGGSAGAGGDTSSAPDAPIAAAIVDSGGAAVFLPDTGSLASSDTSPAAQPDSGTTILPPDSGLGLAADTDLSEGTGCIYSSSSHVLPTCYSLDGINCPMADGCYWVSSEVGTTGTYSGYCGGSRVPCNQSLHNKCSNGCIFAYACSGTMPPCDQLTDEQTCVNNNCTWSGGCGGGTTRAGCAQNPDKADCQNYQSCVWSPIPTSPCSGTRTPCSQILDKQTCTQIPCTSGGCACTWSTSLGCWESSPPTPCNYIQDKTSCQAVPGCSWGT
jgi:hypothetical protein